MFSMVLLKQKVNEFDQRFEGNTNFKQQEQITLKYCANIRNLFLDHQEQEMQMKSHFFVNQKLQFVLAQKQFQPKLYTE